MSIPTRFAQTLLAASAVICFGAAHAAMPKNVYDTAKEEVKAGYKAESDACDKLKDNAKDICVAEAKGRRDVALAHLEYQYTLKEGDRLKVYEEAYKARYDVAMEVCDDKSGDAKDLCQREAKTARDKDKASAKLDAKVTKAFNQADESYRKANYKLAKERCDKMTGDAKSSCEASAKARYEDF